MSTGTLKVHNNVINDNANIIELFTITFHVPDNNINTECEWIEELSVLQLNKERNLNEKLLVLYQQRAASKCNHL